LLRIEGWARDGLTDEQIAKNIGITRKTIYEWFNKYSDIRDAVKKGRAPVDVEIENAMAKAARGHFVKVKKPVKLRTEKRIKKINKDGVPYDAGLSVEEHIEYVDEEIYIPPNVTAQIFWLKNRKPDQWKDKREQSISTKDGVLADLISGLKEPVEDEAG